MVETITAEDRTRLKNLGDDLGLAAKKYPTIGRFTSFFN